MKKNIFSDATLFYAHAGLFAFSEIIFILSLPVFLYTQGFSLSFIFLFHGLTNVFGYFLTDKIIPYVLRTNIKRVLIMGVIFYIIFGFAALLINTANYWWLVAFLFLSLQALFYFPARHLFFVEIAERGTVGLQTGVLNAVSLIARVIAPVAAGGVVVMTSFNSVFLFGALVMILSVLPILFIRTKVEIDFKRGEFLKMSKSNPIFTKTGLAYVADGMNNVITYLMWPLLFFLLLGNEDFFQLGSLMTITSAISAAIMVMVGHLFDKQHRKILFSGSIIAEGIASLLRFALLFFHPLVFVYATQSLYSFSESALQSTFDSYFYSYGKITNTAFFTIHREINFSLGRFILCVFLALMSYFITKPEQLWYLFLITLPVLFLYFSKTKIDGAIEGAKNND